jgi:hypothetical protein
MANGLITLFSEVTDKDSGIKASVFGAVDGMHGVLATSTEKSGACLFYCIKHERLFSPNQKCKDCEGAKDDKIPAPVQDITAVHA